MSRRKEKLTQKDLLRIEAHQRRNAAGIPVNHSWYEAHPNQGSIPSKRPDIYRTLRADNDYLCGTATFQRKDGIWSLKHRDPSLCFLDSIHFNDLKNELLRRGFRWSWSKDTLSQVAVTERPGDWPAGPLPASKFAPEYATREETGAEPVARR